MNRTIFVLMLFTAITISGCAPEDSAIALQKATVARVEKARGTDHAIVAVELTKLATIYYERGQYANAEPLLQRALKITEAAFGHDNADTARCFANLARLHDRQGHSKEAEGYYKQALAIQQKTKSLPRAEAAAIIRDVVALYIHDGHITKANNSVAARLASVGMP